MRSASGYNRGMRAISDFLSADHDRLDALFTAACADPDRVDLGPYEEFRRGLLKHVGMEELVLFAAARRLTGTAVPLAARARVEHGALTALLIPTPTPKLLAVLRSLLGPHNVMEEEPGGLYAQCEAAVAPEADAVLADLRAARDIPPAPHVDGPHVLASINRALSAAGSDATL